MITFNNYNNTTSYGSVTRNGAGVLFNTTSDGRLKPDRRPIKNARKILDGLRVYDHGILGSSTRGVGVVAQEAHEVLPQMITVGDRSNAAPGTPGFKSWQADYSKAVPHLIAGAQSLFTKADEHDARLCIIERRLGISA